MPLTVVLSTGQSRNPEKRALEEAIVNTAKEWNDVRVVVIPHLYDLVSDGPSVTQLKQVNGPLAVMSWMYERATHWVLDRIGVQGQLVPTELSEQEDEDEDQEPAAVSNVVVESKRTIHCIDLSAQTNVDVFVSELRRLADDHKQASEQTEEADQVVEEKKPKQELTLANIFFGNDAIASDLTPPMVEVAANVVQKVEEHPTRRWYPVIDFSRCTNCMECIDFCLFGVYGVDASERILVEQPDNCRKGCPACSRVCPANAIIFPQHKTPAIAGALGGDSSFKIDLSKLFGAPETDEDAKQVAARERDEQLILAGRSAVGAGNESSGIPTRTTAVIKSEWSAKKPENAHLDSLLDQLDESGL